MPDDRLNAISEAEGQEVGDLSAPRARIIYEVVRRQGEDELSRPAGSLFWSGLAGGVTITASLIAQGALRQKLPPAMLTREAISEIGYSLGFIMVILGRMQLFTEQTIVAVLPMMAEPNAKRLLAVARLWAIVLVANLLGAGFGAAINVYLHLMGPDLMASMVEVAGALLRKAPLETMLTGIPAGFLIASVAWIRAGASGGEFWIILALTYTIALGSFTHVIAGSAEAFLLVFAGQTTLGHAVSGIVLPSLVGNVIGGTGLFALLAHAQVRQEL